MTDYDDLKNAYNNAEMVGERQVVKIRQLREANALQSSTIVDLRTKVRDRADETLRARVIDLQQVKREGLEEVESLTEKLEAAENINWWRGQQLAAELKRLDVCIKREEALTTEFNRLENSYNEMVAHFKRNGEARAQVDKIFRESAYLRIPLHPIICRFKVRRECFQICSTAVSDICPDHFRGREMRKVTTPGSTIKYTFH